MLDLPSVVRADNGALEDSVTALAMLCSRLAWPRRLADIQLALGWESSRVSRIADVTAAHLFERWKHVLRYDHHRLRPQTLRRFADKLVEAGCSLDNCWGFLDGTLRKVARPDWNQRILYNGWKRYHALKYHCLLTPDGLIAHVYGPVEGRRHDEVVYRMSGLPELLALHSWDVDGGPMVIYGDSGYGLSNHLLSPFSSINISSDQKRWNYQMSRVRQSVEWSFANITRLWTTLDFPRINRVLQTATGLHYLAAVLLANAHAILYPNQVSQQFRCAPPTLEEYFQGYPSYDDHEVWDNDGLGTQIWHSWEELRESDSEGADSDLMED